MATRRSHGVSQTSFTFLKGGMALLFIMMGFERVMAAQYTVGDSTGWGLGNDLQSWSSQLAFHVGDELYFTYPAGQHSVLLVTEDDYNNCNTENPITSDNGEGDMVITLVDAETYFFICGVPGHCAQGLRLSIKVESEAPAASATPPPDEVTHSPPPDDEAHYPPPPEEVTHNPPPHDPKVESPPHASPDTAAPSPPYYSKYNTFHRNSSPPLDSSILVYSITLVLGLSCTLSML